MKDFHDVRGRALDSGIIWYCLAFTLLCFGCSVENDEGGGSNIEVGDASQEDVGASEQVDMGRSAVDDAMQASPDASMIDAEVQMPTADASTTDMEQPAPFEPSHPNDQIQGQLFQCDGLPTPSPRRIRRINRKEWTRSVGQSSTSGSSRNPLYENAGALFPTYSQDVTLDVATLDQFLSINRIPGGSWVANYGDPRLDLVKDLRADLGCFQNQAAMPDEACMAVFVRLLLERGVLFRRATDVEVNQLIEFATQTLNQEVSSGQTRAQTIIKITRAAWLTSGALFRTEMGTAPDVDGRWHLSDDELALALAHGLSHHAPGSPTYVYYDNQPQGFLSDIGDAARDGSISDPSVIAGFVRQYAGGMDPGELGADEDPDDIPDSASAQATNLRAGRADLRQDFGTNERARRGEYYVSEKVRDFFRSWLGYADVAAVFKDRPEATSAFDDGGTSSVYRDLLTAWNNAMSGYYGHEPLLIQLLDDIIARVVVQDSEVLRNLLTTRRFYVPSSVSTPHGGAPVAGNLYGIDSANMPIGDNRAARWVELPSNERAGVLTHPAWLAAHGGNFENDPSVIHRGKWIRENLLCELVPDVPITVDAQLDADTVHLSARARVAAKTEEPQCTGCHSLMNPLGYPFEIYNHAGFLRADDHGANPNGEAVLQHMPEPELNGPVTDAVDMMERLADSSHVKRCFIRQNFRYFMGRNETYADACTLSAMEVSYDRNDGSMIEMLVTLFTSEAFLYRVDMPEGEQ